jgi:glycerol-3-phosphate O-acyltransferase
METLNAMFRDYVKEVAVLSKASTVVTEQTVFQPGNPEILPYLDRMAEALILPGSGVDGMNHLEELLEKAESGKSCLLMLEHYSNMDLTLFSYLVRKAGGRGDAIDQALVSIAGMKLTEENPVVSALASAYTRLIICPSRSLLALDAEKDREEIIRYNSINRGAMKTLMDLKVRGKLILVFPSGTRYRPWDPATKKGVREIDSYVKSFDYMCPVAINGEVLHVHQGDMMEDSVSKDLVCLTAGPVLSCAGFRGAARARAEAAGIEDKKQATVDAIMELLEDLHKGAEENRQRLLKDVLDK